MLSFFRDFTNLGDTVVIALMSVIPALLCITIHELAHGFAAYKLGDNTAKDMGRLTLNPIKHIDPIGLLMMLLVRFGWAKPVPVNMHNFNRPKLYMAITALAGPISNIILAAIVMLIFALVFNLALGSEVFGSIIISFFYNTIFLSIALAVFNLLPIPPLDGSKVLFSLLPEAAYYKLMRYEKFGIIVLLVALNSEWIFGIDLLRSHIMTATQGINSFLFSNLFLPFFT